MELISASALLTFSTSGAAMVMVLSTLKALMSLMEDTVILVAVSSMTFLMVAPPLPIIRPMRLL